MVYRVSPGYPASWATVCTRLSPSPLPHSMLATVYGTAGKTGSGDKKKTSITAQRQE